MLCGYFTSRDEESARGQTFHDEARHFFVIEGLFKTVLDPEGPEPARDCGGEVAGHCKEGDGGVELVLMLDELVAVHDRHLKVGEDQGHWHPDQDVQCLESVFRSEDGIPAR